MHSVYSRYLLCLQIVVLYSVDQTLRELLQLLVFLFLVLQLTLEELHLLVLGWTK